MLRKLTRGIFIRFLLFWGIFFITVLIAGLLDLFGYSIDKIVEISLFSMFTFTILGNLFIRPNSYVKTCIRSEEDIQASYLNNNFVLLPKISSMGEAHFKLIIQGLISFKILARERFQPTQYNTITNEHLWSASTIIVN